MNANPTPTSPVASPRSGLLGCMDHDDIEQEVKRENDRKWQASEGVVKREHELKMKRLGRSGVSVEVFIPSMLGGIAFTWIVAGTTCHYIGESDARKTDGDVRAIDYELDTCRRRFDNMATRAQKGEG